MGKMKPCIEEVDGMEINRHKFKFVMRQRLMGTPVDNFGYFKCSRCGKTECFPVKESQHSDKRNFRRSDPRHHAYMAAA